MNIIYLKIMVNHTILWAKVYIFLIKVEISFRSEWRESAVFL
jgi:hypothetical protein